MAIVNAARSYRGCAGMPAFRHRRHRRMLGMWQEFRGMCLVHHADEFRNGDRLLGSCLAATYHRKVVRCEQGKYLKRHPLFGGRKNRCAVNRRELIEW
nr:hypothetical protein CFP56_79167 [Quercus suber]